MLIQKGEQHEMMQGMLHSREISLHGWLESVPDLIFVQDVNLAIIDCNVTFEHFVGLAKSYIIGKSPKDIFTDPDKLKLVEKYSEEVIREGNVIQTEEAFRKKSGNTYFYNCVKAPLRSSGGYLEGVIGIFRNVTDNRWSTAGYNARKDQPALPMEAFPIGLWDVGVSLDGLNFQHVDTLLGYESGQFSDLDLKSYFNLVCLEDKRKITRKIGKFIKGRSDTFECEFRMRHKEGHWIWLLALGQNLGDNGGESRKAGGILLDITLRKNAETRLIHLNNTLEKAFAERTKELECAHSRLLNNEKMAAIGLLASGVAHELRNPINFIQMNFAILREYTEDLISLYDLQKKILKRFDDRQSLVLAEKIESEEKKINLKLMLSDMPSLFDETSKGFERVNHIVRAMRNFNRQNGEENFEEIAVNSCIEDTLIIARNEYKYFAEIETNLGNIPPVMANREQINQVFLNLILNAVQAIGSKGKSSDINGYIYIETTTDGNFIYCTIRDNGPGIHEDALSHVFEPFFTTKGSKGGTGLGLSISYDIVVNKHQGDFTVDNHVAGGAIFKICLPINPAADSSSGRSLDNV
ncbi:PAS domain-containing sensor histidine kinase [Desulforhopalus singaporensis]|uniref:PAS domain-containing sensor histidine kinase n=1 Tax=Desulforhopalus singaporensis TaxID=91360 RepID=UPI0015A16FA4|nr:PAS domain S-box protein [Desulforhopalus singaporensis]